MKFICDKELLMDASNNVQRAVSGKSTIPALEGMLLKAGGSSLFMAGYDLDIGITTSIEAQVEASGEIVLNARQFSDIVRRLPGETVAVEADDRMNVHIASGSSEYNVMGISAEDYPDIPSVGDGIQVSLPQNVLKGMIRQTLFAVAQVDAGRPVHTGTLFEMEDDSLRLVSVDGSRMAMRQETVKTSENMQFVIPGKTLAEVLKLLKDEDTPLFMAVGKRHAILQIDGYSVITRLLDGEFLAYRKTIPQTSSTVIQVNTHDIVESVERVSIVSNDRIKSPLVCRFEDSSIYFSCTSSMGSSNDYLSCKTEGDTLEMGFNSRYLLDALKNAETDEIKLELGGSLAPMKIVPVSGESFLFLVLPVRMKR